MTNESIFYIIGVILGGILGYAIRAYTAREYAVKVVVWRPEGEDNEQRD
jgi:hypothetical protein